MYFGEITLEISNSVRYIVKNNRKFTKFLCYKGEVKFDDIHRVFDEKYLKITKRN